MKYRTFLFFIGLMIASCTAAPPAPTATVVLTSAPLPTLTPVPTSTLAPTATFTPTAGSLPPGREIIFEESGDTKFAGTLYGEGEIAIILANMSLGGQKQWDPFVAAMDKEKFTTVTFDYQDVNDVNPDMDVILRRLKEEGFERVVCIGASLGTRACTNIALKPDMIGLVMIAGSVHHASVAEATYPKLFMAGELDVWAFDIQQGFEAAAEPKELVLFENNRAHGTDLFRSQDSEQFLTQLIDFVNGLASP